MYQDKQDLRDTCQVLLDDFADLLEWGWDDRTKALLAEFPTARAEAVRDVLDRHFNREWDHLSIRNAPAWIKTATGDLGDLRNNQLLFTSDPGVGVLIFAAWWPWGNGEVISVRLASPSIGGKIGLVEPGIFTRIMGMFS